MSEQLNLAGKIKQRIIEQSRELTYHISRILKAKDLTKGTVCIQKKKCGNHRCKCAGGELHRAKVLSLSHNGKTRLIPLTKYSITEIMRIEKQARNYQLFRRNRAKVAYLSKELIQSFNLLERQLLIEVIYPKED